MDPAFRRRWGYVYILGALLLLGVALAAWLTHRQPELLPLGLLAAMSVVAEWRRLDTGDSSSVSLSSVLTLTTAFIVGPVGAAIVGAASMGLAPKAAAPATRSLVRAFNTVMSGLLGLCAGTVFVALGGWNSGQPWHPDGVVMHVVVPGAIATFVMYVLNSLMVGGMMRADRATPRLRSAMRVLLTHSTQPYLASAIAAFLFITLWEGSRLGPLSALLMAVPLLLAQWAFQEQSRARWAQRRTVDLLAALIDNHLPERAAHNADVQHISRVVGAVCDLHPRDLEHLRSAAKLLDLGRVTAQRREWLAEEDPDRAAAFIQGIGFLNEPVRLVQERHRSFTDSTRRLGHPSQTSQVLAVADAAASGMDVRAAAGSRFDPRVVDAYESAVEHGDLNPSVSV